MTPWAATRQATLSTKTICSLIIHSKPIPLPQTSSKFLSPVSTPPYFDFSGVDKFTEKAGNSSPQKARVHVHDASQTSPATPDSCQSSPMSPDSRMDAANRKTITNKTNCQRCQSPHTPSTRPEKVSTSHFQGSQLSPSPLP